MPSRLKKQFFYTIIVWTVLLSTVELGFRWLFYSQTKGFHTSLSVQGNTIQEGDSTLVFKNRPFYLDFDRKFQYNEVSMKVEPGNVSMPAKANNEFWVLLLGGSAMEGMGSNKDGEWLDITGQADYPWNESIPYYLEKYLHKVYPEKKVKVFNTAASSYTLGQSFLRYRELAKKFDFDFVVSLDGQNDPPALQNGETSIDYMKKDWEKRPSKSFPASWLLFLTQRSAAVYQLKQQFFHWRINRRSEKNIEDSFPRRKFWENQPILAFNTGKNDEGVDRAVASYFSSLEQFDRELRSEQKNHLFLLQPHILFRDSTRVGKKERAVLSYFSAYNNDPVKNNFLIKQRDEWRKRFGATDSQFVLLSQADTLSEEVFVDYCHFSSSMNQFMARFIGDKIVSQVATSTNQPN